MSSSNLPPGVTNSMIDPGPDLLDRFCEEPWSKEVAAFFQMADCPELLELLNMAIEFGREIGYTEGKQGAWEEANHPMEVKEAPNA